ncbi:MAG: disulfide bond formation protein DsbD, partial [Prevotellaceae bacterium]|nr:disulfide bond formation protein DsbD [Prevotellaceae bacterium]
PLPEGEWYTSAFDGKQKKTLGQKNMDYLVTRYKTNAIPYFAILNSSGAPQGAPIGYTSGTDKFIEFLSEGN